MQWRRKAVGPTTATWGSEYGAVLTFLKDGEGVKFLYFSEGRGWARGRIVFLSPVEIPFISEVKTSKVKREGVKFLRLEFTLNGVNYAIEEEVLKR